MENKKFKIEILKCQQSFFISMLRNKISLISNQSQSDVLEAFTEKYNSRILFFSDLTFQINELKGSWYIHGASIVLHYFEPDFNGYVNGVYRCSDFLMSPNFKLN